MLLLLLLLLLVVKPGRQSRDAVAKATETPRGADVTVVDSLLPDVVAGGRDVSRRWQLDEHGFHVIGVASTTTRRVISAIVVELSSNATAAVKDKTRAIEPQILVEKRDKV